MAKVICDFTEAKEFDRTPIPAGVYKATIDATYAQEIKTGRSEKATPYVSLGFVITEPDEYAGRVVFSNYMLSGPGAGNTKQLLKMLGLYSDDQGNRIALDTNALHGYEVKIKVRVRTLPDGTEVNDVMLVAPTTACAATA